ncbi:MULTISPECIES: sensor histidine kinase [Streptomyces]|uniref:sensor histidine kinase n=1 Tax=Streptomyces TaxID=1883 RepID=UPI001478DC9A|nr:MULTISPECIES: sensor histidine kinase [Streptomyces]
MSWRDKVRCRFEAMRSDVREAREHQRYYKANKGRLKAECRAARKAGGPDAAAGPPPTGFTLLPWLLLGMGAFSNLFEGRAADPWIGGLGLLTFNSLYIYVAFRSFDKRTREALSTRVALALLAAVTCALAAGYGGNWLLFFPLLGLATGAALRLRHLRPAGTVLAVLAGAVAWFHDGWGGLDIAYATWISTMVTAAIMRLSEAVRELRAAREELAHRAVEKERLRFSRDLHDLLGHTMSVIVVKSEAARRLAGRDLDAALAQITDIEAVGRQALTEIREAVSGYRQGSLAAELDRARSVLTAAGITLVVSRSGPPPGPQTEALLGWVVREAVTNVVRHSGAGRCEITLAGGGERVRLTVVDDGGGAVAGDTVLRCDAAPTGSDGKGLSNCDGTGLTGSARTGAGPHSTGLTGSARTGAGPHSTGLTGSARTEADSTRTRVDSAGTGLTGLTERLAAAGGSLNAGSRARGGFAVAAELPADAAEERPEGSGAAGFRNDPDVYVGRWSARPHVEAAGNG